MKFQHQFNSDYVPSKGETVDQTKKSLTMPDQTLSLRRLLENHSRGLPTSAVNREGIYTDQEIPVIQDLTDLPELRMQLEDRAEHLRNQLDLFNEEKNAKIKEQAKKEAKAEILDEQASKKSPEK